MEFIVNLKKELIEYFFPIVTKRDLCLTRYPQTQPPSTATTRAFCQIPRDSHHSRQINRGHGGKGIEDTYGDNPTGYFIKQCETWKYYSKVRVSILV